MNPKTLNEWEKWLKDNPDQINYVWHDPAAQLDEFRSHNTLLHLVVLGHWSGTIDSATLAGLLLRLGADPNRQNDLGDTPLHYACQTDTRSSQIVDLLLQHGANSTVLNRAGESPLTLAAGASEESQRITNALNAHQKAS